MSYTVTLHAWWALAYAAVGVVLWLPLEWLAWRSIASPKGKFWPDLWRSLRRRWYTPWAVMLLWPLAVWEQVR